VTLGHPPIADAGAVLHSVAVEALCGPLWLQALLLAVNLRRGTLIGQVAAQEAREERFRSSFTGQLPPPLWPRRMPDTNHPAGAVRLGFSIDGDGPCDITVGELAQHVLIPGASGSGKTTTLSRLAGGCVEAGFALVIVDCKGGGLGSVARRLAQLYRLPFQTVDPDADAGDEAAIGYNVCSGDAASVGNKLVGSFTYGPSAEIFKNISMEVVPVLARGLAEAGRPVTLQALYDVLASHTKIEELATAVYHRTNNEGLRDLLLRFGEDAEPRGLIREAYLGLQKRLGALLEGKFGELFRRPDALDWDTATSAPCVTYLALSATASSEDVELMGRVIAQDLKQLCARRLAAQERGVKLQPVLVVFDEFAALREAQQIVDLLLQARQALLSVVISTQFLPETVPLRTPCLQAGVIIAHRVASEDANSLAAEFGTRTSREMTHAIDKTTGQTDKGSIRRVEEYRLHPNHIRDLTPGLAAVRIAGRMADADVVPVIRVQKDAGGP